MLSEICSSEVTLVSGCFKLLLSLCLGAIVGIERRQKGQVAGMRTFALISMGATLAMLVSIYIPQEYMGLKNGDPGRIAAQVISGIGFLGAGAIIQMKGSVRGLTLAVGSGMYLISTAACLLIIVVLKAFEAIEKYLLNSHEQKIVRLKVGKIITDASEYHKVFDNHSVHISDEFLRYDYTQGCTTINFMIRTRENTNFISLFDEIHSLGDVLSLTLTNEVNN
mgnify:CR=1 FL=1